MVQIAKWHAEFPDCAWGVPTSAERAVVDSDPRNGGDESLAALTAQHGPLPPCPKVRTGGDGAHYWLKFPPGTKCGKIAAGIDLKADGGYVIVPPSKIDIPEHEGRAYVWSYVRGKCRSPTPPHGSPLSEDKACSSPLCSGGDEQASIWIVQQADDLFFNPALPRGGASSDDGQAGRRPPCQGRQRIHGQCPSGSMGDEM